MEHIIFMDNNTTTRATVGVPLPPLSVAMPVFLFRIIHSIHETEKKMAIIGICLIYIAICNAYRTCYNDLAKFFIILSHLPIEKEAPDRPRHFAIRQSVIRHPHASFIVGRCNILLTYYFRLNRQKTRRIPRDR